MHVYGHVVVVPVFGCYLCSSGEEGVVPVAGGGVAGAWGKSLGEGSEGVGVGSERGAGGGVSFVVAEEVYVVVVGGGCYDVGVVVPGRVLVL